VKWSEAPPVDKPATATVASAGTSKWQDAPPLDKAPNAPAGPMTLSAQPNLGGVPLVGPLLSAMGYNGVPKVNEPGYTPSSVPILDPINSFAHGFLNGVPIVGPMLNSAADKLDALTYGEKPDVRAALNASDQQQFPTASTVGEVTGTVAPLAVAGATSLGGKILGLTGSTAQRIGASLGSTAALTTADQMARGKSFQDAVRDALVPSLVSAAVPGGERVVTNVVKSFGKTAAPTVEALKEQAGKIYDAARDSGVQMSQEGTINLSDRMYELAQNEGLVSPTGRVDTSYPKIVNALQTFDDYSHGSMTVPQMQSVRRKLQDAAASADSGEKRIGTIMLRKFDQVVAQGVPELSQASALYHKAMKGQEIEQAIELAGNRAGQFSGSGFENALRTEFRALDRRYIKGDLPGYTQEEIDAIRKVASGGPIENILRYFGKAAPTGIVSALGGAGAGYLAGGPVGAAAVMGTGAGARMAATALQKRNAAVADALVRRGGPAVMGDKQRAIVQAILASSPGIALGARGLAMQEAQ